MTHLTTEEQLAVDEYVKVDKAYNDVSVSLEEVFLRGVRKILETGDIPGAIEYARLMPESVAKMYVFDAIRVARGDFDKD
jgi:hypothetical protein